MSTDDKPTPPRRPRVGGPTYGKPGGSRPGAAPPSVDSHAPPPNIVPFPASKPGPTLSPASSDQEAWLVKKIKGVPVQIFLDVAGDAQEKTPGHWVFPVKALWRIEGLGEFTPKEPLFAPRDTVLFDPDWREKAYPRLRFAIITSIEEGNR